MSNFFGSPLPAGNAGPAGRFLTTPPLNDTIYSIMNPIDPRQFIEEARSAIVLRPLDGPAVRATNFEVRYDGGAFTIHIYDNRESTEIRPLGPSKKWEAVEIARYSLSPLALLRLRDALMPNISVFEAVMGRPIPSEAENNASLLSLMDKAVEATKAK